MKTAAPSVRPLCAPADLSAHPEKCTGSESTVDETAVRKQYGQLTRMLISRGRTVATMESCTAGQVASLITDTEGASAVFRGAFVAYGNEQKIRLGVPAEIIARFGVYSAETASAMAEVCRAAFGADVGVGITGTFGNADPANGDSVPGEVFFAVSTEGGTTACACTVPPQPSRLAYKLYAAGLIADKLAEFC